MNSDKMLLIVGLVGGIAALIVTIGFVGQGNVRQAEIFWPENVKQTIAIDEMNGTTYVQGIKGVLGENPTLLSRTGFAYLLTIENHQKESYSFYIDGFDIQTDVITPGGVGLVKIYPDSPGEYDYYLKSNENLTLIGQIEIVSVVPSDEFTGIWKDLI